MAVVLLHSHMAVTFFYSRTAVALLHSHMAIVSLHSNTAVTLLHSHTAVAFFYSHTAVVLSHSHATVVLIHMCARPCWTARGEFEGGILVRHLKRDSRYPICDKGGLEEEPDQTLPPEHHLVEPNLMQKERGGGIEANYHERVQDAAWYGARALNPTPLSPESSNNHGAAACSAPSNHKDEYQTQNPQNTELHLLGAVPGDGVCALVREHHSKRLFHVGAVEEGYEPREDDNFASR